MKHAIRCGPLPYVLLGSGLYLCFELFSLRGTPFLLGGDEQVFWMNALRMMHGELPYRDFFEFTPPGTDVVYLGAFATFGARIWVPNIVQLLLGITLTCLCFHIARSIMKPAAAAFAAALFLVLDFGRWLDATHHWFSLLAVMAATAVLLSGSTAPRVLICGALLGLASFFTQTRGVVAALGFAGFLVWEGIQQRATGRRHAEQLLRLLLALILTWVVLSSYFIFELGITKLFYFQAVYVLGYVTNQAHNIFPADQDVLVWPIRQQIVYFAAPVIYAISLWRCSRRAVRSPSIDVRPTMLLTFVGAAMFLEVALSPNWLRVDCVVLPAIILLVGLLVGPAEQLSAHAHWRRYATALAWIGLIVLGAHEIRSRNLVRSLIIDLPAGRAAVDPSTGEKLAWLVRHTRPGALFFQASYQSLYLPLGLRNPIFAFLDRYTSPELVELDLRQLAAARVRYILWSPLDQPRYPKFEQFLTERYRRVWRFPDGDEVWELNS